MTSTEREIYKFIKANPLCWTSDISNETGLTQIQLRPMLMKMVEDGHLEVENKTRIYKWKIKEAVVNNHC